MPYKDPDVRRERQREYQRRWFQNPLNCAQQRASMKRRVAEIKAEVALLKQITPCADCDEHHPPECMDFDHLPGFVKVDNVSTMLTSHGYNAVVAEIAKCEIVCANCHRKRTKSRLGC